MLKGYTVWCYMHTGEAEGIPHAYLKAVPNWNCSKLYFLHHIYHCTTVYHLSSIMNENIPLLLQGCYSRAVC